MSILRANLKHLYQKRSFWFVGAIFGVFFFFTVVVIVETVTENKQGGFAFVVPLMLLMGMIIATMPIDVLTKPFSYCLPGHRKIPGKFLFSVGFVLSFLWSLTFLVYPGLNIIDTILVYLSAFFTFTISYWLGAWLVFRFKNGAAAAMVFFGCFLPFIMVANGWFDLFEIMETIIVEGYLRMILFGVIINYLAWKYFGNPNIARRYCGTMRLGTSDAWNMRKIAKYKQAKLAEREKKKAGITKMSPVVEKFFISRITGAGTGPGRYICGSLYKSFGMTISRYHQNWIKFLMLWLLILCFLGYSRLGEVTFFFMPGIMAIHINLWVRSNLLIAGGREERFWSALVLAATIAAVITIAATVMATVTIPLEMVMPKLTIKGHEWAYQAIDTKCFFVPFLMLPVTFTACLIFHKNPVLRIIFVIACFQILFMGGIFSHLMVMNIPVRIDPVHIIIAMVFAWALFTGVLRYISMRCCLVGQTK